MKGQMGKWNIAEALLRKRTCEWMVTTILHLRDLGAPGGTRDSTEIRGSSSQKVVQRGNSISWGLWVLKGNPVSWSVHRELGWCYPDSRSFFLSKLGQSRLTGQFGHYQSCPMAYLADPQVLCSKDTQRDRGWILPLQTRTISSTTSATAFSCLSKITMHIESSVDAAS